MKRKIRENRDKAFLGAVIGAVGSIAGGIIGRRQQKKALRKQQIAANEQATLEGAQNITNAYSNQDYVDDFQDKIEFRKGGKMKTKGYTDRLSREKKFKCGGRSKKSVGGLKWTGADTSQAIGAIGSLGATIASTYNNTINTTNAPAMNAGDGVQAPDYVNESVTLKCGGRKRKCKGGFVIKRR